MENSKTPNKAVIAIIVIVLLVVAGTAAIVLTNNQTSTDSSSNTASDLPTTAPSSSTDEGTTSSSSDTFTNGTYSSTGSYQTPGGQESIGVKVTLTDGVITDASVTQMGETGEAKQFQAQFASGFKSQVVGKKVSDVKLSRVAGSSLTPNGFNSALSEIQKQAQG
jgi:hypothetical protein